MLGAPVLRGQVGSLIALLDACLVNGWGIQTATSCVVASGVCTMTFPLDHAAPVDAVVLVAGSSIADLNGEQKVTAVAPNVVKFATAASNGTSTGTITAKMAPAGFNKPFSGTNLAVYKSADVAANGHFCRVNDTNALYARVNGYENMTAISTGTGLFPTAIQLSGGMYWHKSAAASTTPVDWTIVGDGRFFAIFTSTYMGADPSYTDYVAPNLSGFGDPLKRSRAADPFNTLIIGNWDTNAYNYAAGVGLSAGNNVSRYMARAISGTGTAVPANIHAMGSIVAQDPLFDRITGQIMFSPCVVKTDSDASWRAELPGICLGESTYMEQVFASKTVFKAGSPERSYLVEYAADVTASLVNHRLIALDVTGPWPR
ncbi:hypothetical protein POHY109586_02125 [Polaromonas hydrogenivorans]